MFFIDNSNREATLHVPAASVDAYGNTENRKYPYYLTTIFLPSTM